MRRLIVLVLLSCAAGCAQPGVVLRVPEGCRYSWHALPRPMPDGSNLVPLVACGPEDAPSFVFKSQEPAVIP